MFGHDTFEHGVTTPQHFNHGMAQHVFSTLTMDIIYAFFLKKIYI